MHVSIDLSLYPLTPDYEAPIIAFIERLHGHAGIQVATNHLATQLTGEYDTVMDVLKEAMRPTLASETACSFVIKLLNVVIVPGEAATL
ncbi:hypothetical protein LEM8419_00655 [Neolewinella maritima]|uniref:Thiamin/hydroxymethyl pyrimidine-binding YkoF putative domain-containing protein n=1 Tax=Neolewinella maritima TaxID=1383882 RepID=A0ABM9AYJ0_9BACT|nr:Ykof family thiamine-binding protein [Neolewinella maritima]CAH0999357.1 hypothetical protein LEM8419_00655 [Neolewinella maritima]